jgi:hypothetical protein
MVLLSVVIHYLDVVRIAVTPREADPPAVIDPNAVLAGPVLFQRLQPIARMAPKSVRLGAASSQRSRLRACSSIP